jgi:uncharacterized protein DUF2283
MAHLTFTDLVKAVAEHPDAPRWEAGVKPGEALYIAFASGRDVQSETFEAADGSMIVIDRDAGGQVCGIEIT